MNELQASRRLPRTVDEVADLLIADLPLADRATLSRLDDHDFGRLHQTVAGYIINEFKLWNGNDELLASCMAVVERGGKSSDPSMVILERVRSRLRDYAEVFVVT
jgi:hypothetical protein